MNICDELEKALSIKLDTCLHELVLKYTSIRKFTAGTILLHAAQNSDNVYLILCGIVRGYYLDQNGNEITKCFSVEHEFFCTENFRTGKPATYSIECLEDCTCMEIPYCFIRQAIQQNGALGAAIGRMFEQEVNRLEHHNRNILMLDAEGRYINFCEKNPLLHRRIPLKYIASYIAIRPETLSRIRKKHNMV